MRLHRLNRLSIILLVMFGCTSDSQPETAQTSEQPIMLQFLETCDVVLDHFVGFGFTPTVENDDESCLVDGAASLDELGAEADPLDSLRHFMMDRGWSESLEHSADGPGTTAFRLLSEGLYCQIHGGAPAWLDDDGEIRQSDDYLMNVECHIAP